MLEPNTRSAFTGRYCSSFFKVLSEAGFTYVIVRSRSAMSTFVGAFSSMEESRVCSRSISRCLLTSSQFTT